MDGDKIVHHVLSPQNEDVIYGHKNCQTIAAKWMCIDKVYEKFHRHNFYDIGGTYIEDIRHFWFTFKTEQVGSTFLMHLFTISRQAGTFKVSVSYNNDLNIDKKNNVVTLSQSLTEYEFKDPKECPLLYLCTYSFTDDDVNLLKDKQFYIAVSFQHTFEKSLNQQIIDDIKANHDFRQLLSDPYGADFTMESAEGDKFPAHKVLLSVHSEVFKAMLNNYAESQSNHVKLVKVATEDLSHMLEFIYTGTISDLDRCNFFSLLMLADQYNIKGLRELSQYALTQQMTSENAFETLMVADMCNCDTLKLKALWFIKKHPSALQVNSFKEINNADLIKELCEFIAL